MRRKDERPDESHSVRVQPFPPPGWYLDEDLPQPLSSVQITMTHLRSIVDFWRAGDYKVASRRLVELVRNVGERHFDTFPATIRDLDGKAAADSFVILRLRSHLSCIDLEHSELKWGEYGYISDMRRTVLNEGAIPSSRHLFVLRERTTVEVASQALMNAWKAEGLTGQEFIVPDTIKSWW